MRLKLLFFLLLLLQACALENKASSGLLNDPDEGLYVCLPNKSCDETGHLLLSTCDVDGDGVNEHETPQILRIDCETRGGEGAVCKQAFEEAWCAIPQGATCIDDDGTLFLCLEDGDVCLVGDEGTLCAPDVEVTCPFATKDDVSDIGEQTFCEGDLLVLYCLEDLENSHSIVFDCGAENMVCDAQLGCVAAP